MHLKTFIRLLQWILKAAIFLTMLAFALNNREDVSVRFFWDMEWSAPMVLVLLAVFAIGVVVGVAGMVPRWWQQRRLAKKAIQDTASAPANKPSTEAVAANMYGP
jgi:lipopolysaccharide assembly protein A